MTVFDLCKSPVITISSEANLQQAAILMDAKSVGCLVVTDANQTPIGILTDRDIVTRAVVRGHASDSQTVGSVMTKNLIDVPAGMEIDEALGIMRKARVRRLVVVDGANKRLCGILSADDVLLMIFGQANWLGDIYFLQDKSGQTHFRSDFSEM